MSMRRLAKEFRKNWKFFIGMVVAAAIAGAAAVFLSRGIDTGLSTLPINEKARNNPEQSTEQEKANSR